MIQGALHPRVLIALLASVVMLTASFALAGPLTSAASHPPASSVSRAAASPTLPSAVIVSEHEYTGIVSWMTKDAITIVDQYGVTRVFSINIDTNVVDKKSQEAGRLSDVSMQSYVRIKSIEGGADAYASVITVSRR